VHRPPLTSVGSRERDQQDSMIGPGGAGKSTVGAVLAQRLQIGFLDLDRYIAGTIGDIGGFIDLNGYESYARANVEAYCSLERRRSGPQVQALSSGFMTYAGSIHRRLLERCGTRLK
jgi:shikimate kinase